MTITPITGLKMGGAVCDEGITGLCANDCDTVWRVSSEKGPRGSVGSGARPEYAALGRESGRLKEIESPRRGSGGQPQMGFPAGKDLSQAPSLGKPLHRFLPS